MKKVVEKIICDLCSNELKETDLLSSKDQYSNIEYDDRGNCPNDVGLKQFGFFHVFFREKTTIKTQHLTFEKFIWGKPRGTDICSECEEEIKRTLQRLRDKSKNSTL